MARTTVGEVEYKVYANTTEFTREIKQAENDVQKLSKSNDGLSTSARKLATDMAKLAGAMVGLRTVSRGLNSIINDYKKLYGSSKDATPFLRSMSELDEAIRQVKLTIGSILEVAAPIISLIAQWVIENKELVAGVIAAVGAFIALVSVIKLVATVASIASAPIALLAAGLAVIVGFGVAGGIKNLGIDFDKLAESTKKASKQNNGYAAASAQTAKQVKKLRQQLVELREQFRQDLKRIAVDHQETIDDLNRQIQEANLEYNRSVSERLAAFTVTENQEKRAHQDKVDALQNQLRFLQKYNNDYNQEKLAQVQFALERELALYEKEEADRQAELDIQNELDRQRLEERLEQNKKELDEELAFMKKHREELQTVRDVILLDEIELLEKQYKAQQKSYEEQIKAAQTGGAGVGASYGAGLDAALSSKELKDSLFGDGEEMGKRFFEGFKKGAEDFMATLGGGFWDWIKRGGPAGSIARGAKSALERWANGESAVYKGFSAFDQWVKGNTGYASGGYTGAGGKYDVAGVVHRGEFVLPREQVDQATGQPKLSPTNITINVAGVLATSETAKRQFAMEMAEKVNQVMSARSLA